MTRAGVGVGMRRLRIRLAQDAPTGKSSVGAATSDTEREMVADADEQEEKCTESEIVED